MIEYTQAFCLSPSFRLWVLWGRMGEDSPPPALAIPPHISFFCASQNLQSEGMDHGSLDGLWEASQRYVPAASPPEPPVV